MLSFDSRRRGRRGRRGCLPCAALVVGFLMFGFGAGVGEASAAPYRPAADAEVLERLPSTSGFGVTELGRMRRALAERPQDLDLALDLARRYVSLGNAEADPRYYGWAEAALRPWWDLEAPPVEVLVLRAVIHQRDHAFDRALVDLDRALAVQPRHPQALLTRAFVLMAVGRWDEAALSCRALPRGTDRLAVATCAGRAASLTGRGEAAYALLQAAVSGAPGAPGELRVWASTNLAEIAARLGRPADAERHFRDALAIARDPYLLGTYADFLLGEGRAEEARALLQDETRSDALLLRLAIAETRLGLASAGPHRDVLEARFEAAARRGARAHQREEARFALDVLGRPADALRLAEANWSVQKEPCDAALLLGAALAAGAPERARAVVQWVASAGLEDAALAALIRQIDVGEG